MAYTDYNPIYDGDWSAFAVHCNVCHGKWKRMDGSQKTTICRICEQPEHSVQVFMKLCHCITIKGDHWFQTEVEEGITMLWRTPLEKWRRARMFMRTSWSGTSRLSRWRARIMTTTSWFPLVRYGATGTSPCQLMTGQKQVQWISYKYLGTMIWSNSWSAPYVLLRYLNNTNCSISLQILLVSNVYQLCKGDSIKLNFGFHD